MSLPVSPSSISNPSTNETSPTMTFLPSEEKLKALSASNKKKTSWLAGQVSTPPNSDSVDQSAANDESGDQAAATAAAAQLAVMSGYSEPHTAGPLPDGKALSKPAKVIGGPERARKHACDYPNCGGRFFRAQDLMRHRSTHMGLDERPFECPHGCGRRFGRADAARRHAKSSQWCRRALGESNTGTGEPDAVLQD
ncbi:hypothetical protein HK405_002516, partial [Cladochytrium tenue]